MIRAISMIIAVCSYLSVNHNFKIFIKFNLLDCLLD
jgi:hypothetical protein